MTKLAKLSSIILIIALPYQVFSQLDTTVIKSTIVGLTSDSLVKVFWDDLYAVDQDFNTLGDPVKQIENLITALLFFQEKGFQEQLDAHLGEGYSTIIWMHSVFSDLSLATFPMLQECLKVYDSGKEDLNSYFARNILKVKDSVLLTELVNSLDVDFKSIQLKDVVELYNEFNYLHNKIENETIEIIGKWGVDFSTATLYKFTKDESDYYYLHTYGNFSKINKVTDYKYEFHMPISDYYITIEEDLSSLSIVKEGENTMLIDRFDK